MRSILKLTLVNICILRFIHQSIIDNSNYDSKDLQHIAICRNPKAHLMEKVLFTLLNRPNISGVFDRVKANAKVLDLQNEVNDSLNIIDPQFKPILHKV